MPPWYDVQGRGPRKPTLPTQDGTDNTAKDPRKNHHTLLRASKCDHRHRRKYLEYHLLVPYINLFKRTCGNIWTSELHDTKDMTLCFPRALATNCVCLYQSVFYLACLSIAFTPHVVRAHVQVRRCVCVCVCVCVRVGPPSCAQCTPKSAPSRAQCPFFSFFFWNQRASCSTSVSMRTKKKSAA